MRSRLLIRPTCSSARCWGSPSWSCARPTDVVKNKWVFIWMGDPGAADVHEKTLGGSPLIAFAVPTIEATPGPNEAWRQVGVHVSRRIRDVPPSPFYNRFRQFDSNIDRWFIYDFVLPGTLLMHSGGRPIADAEDDMSRAVLLHRCQTVTPESETSTHYFFQQSHRVGHGDGEVAETMYQGFLAAFEQDRQTISAQYENIELDPDAPMLALGMDKAVRSIRQVKISLYVVERVDRLIALANPFKRCGREVVVLKVFQASRDKFAQIVRLGASGLACETIKPRLGFRVLPN